jgi:RNA polymerase sigma-70 factor (ECF subfamily)
MYADGPEDREDLFQETVYQLWRSFPSFAGRSAPGTWIYRVALHTAISALRRRSNARRHVPLEAERLEVAAASAEEDRSELLYRLLRKLSEVDRALVLLHLEDLSYREIGAVLGLSESNVGVKLNRIKAKLQSFARELP